MSKDLTYTGRDGIPIAPLYTEPVEIDVPKRAGPWQIRPSVATAEEAEYARSLGADSVWWQGPGPAPEGLAVAVVDQRTPVASSWELHMMGLTELDELAYLRHHVEDRDVREVRTSVGRDVFKGIAKLRALRVLWKEWTGTNPFLHAVGSTRALTRYDAHTNILRQTTQAFAAAAGGADAITIWPYDLAGGQPGRSGVRLAVTTQLVLREEAMLDSIADPARGSFYLDWLTREFVERTRRTSAEEFAARFQSILNSRDVVDGPIVGVTEFPLAVDEPLPRVETLTQPFEAAPYEALRDDPAGPIYLCKLGSPKEHGETAAFARSLFITGGFTVIEGEGPGGFAASGASIACVVGPGDVEIPGAARVLRDLDPSMDKLAFLKELRS